MTSPAPVFAPTVSTYATRVPYITPAEYAQAATGVDTGNLVPNGSAAQNAAALVRVIARASSWVDNLCYQVLAATRDRQAGRYRVRRDGTIAVPLDYAPVIAVAAASVGPAVNQLSALGDLSGLELGAKVVTIPAAATAGGPAAPVPYFDSQLLAGRGTVYATVDYVNGYANTALAAAAAAGASSITVASPLAIFGGMTLTIADADKTETVTVAASFAPSVTVANTAVPLAAPLANAHATGTPLGALPEAIKEATILLTSALIKTRGAEAYAMPGIGGQPDHLEHSESHGLEDVDVALDLLEPFRRPA